MKKHSLKVFNYIILLAIVYIYIFNPVFIIPGFGLNNILLLIAGIYCLINKKIFLRDVYLYRKELILIGLMIVYLMVTISLTGGVYYKGITDLLGFLTTLLFLPIFLVHVVLRKFKGVGFFNIIIDVGLIAATISITSLLFPSFNMFIRGIQTGVELESVEDLGLSLVRSFGLGGNLTSAYGYMMGLLSALCLLKMPEVKKWYYLIYSLVFFIAAIINARTGVFPFFIVLAILIIRSLKEIRIKYYFVIGLIFISALVALTILERNNYELYEYIYTFINFFSTLEDFDESAYSRMWFLPETIQGLLFGEGINVFGVGDDPNSVVGTTSDIGFIRNIFLGGIVFLFLLLIEQFTLYKNMYRRSGKDLFLIVLGLSVLIFHYKGNLCYNTTAISRFVMLLYFVLVFNEQNKSMRIVMIK